jgi:hypothetical protein
MSTSRRRQSGSVILIVLGAILIVAIIVSQVVGWLGTQMKDRQRLSLSDVANVMRATIINRIENDLAWRNTLAANPNLSCFLGNNQNCTNVDHDFELRRADDTVMLVGNGGSQLGFSPEGIECDTFNPGAGNDLCPFRYTLHVKSICPTPPCMTSMDPATELFSKTPTVRITGELTWKPRNKEKFYNLKELNYAIDHVRGQLSDSPAELADLCADFGGAVDATSGKCNLKVYTIGVCPNFYVFLGLDPSGTPICQPSYAVNSRCMAGSGVVGIAPWGEFVCGKF